MPNATGSCQAEEPEPETQTPQQNLGSVSKDTQRLWPTGQAWPFFKSLERHEALSWIKKPRTEATDLTAAFRLGGWVMAGPFQEPTLGLGKVGVQGTGQDAWGHIQ